MSFVKSTEQKNNCHVGSLIKTYKASASGSVVTLEQVC